MKTLTGYITCEMERFGCYVRVTDARVWGLKSFLFVTARFFLDNGQLSSCRKGYRGPLKKIKSFSLSCLNELRVNDVSSLLFWVPIDVVLDLSIQEFSR